ncbi:hypothetical protein BDV95DRAFT_606790 [Massariosphaeria phaeospora]|uniref:Uncharacterized protein n=1 Tax=Massariosphaeria phaeospora TaxID=100035 RepID=A0A7C8M9V6_9PLEO|nr:hypothetical protein BDV95DRAFT_606790 [Massariosphaeria phaeospora]
MPSLPNPLHLIIYPSPLFAAHWALFLPTPTSTTTPKLGTRIHADGSPATGFTLLVEPEHDLAECAPRSYRVVELGSVGEGKGVGDVERVAREVEVPGKSLKGVGVAGVEGLRRRVEMKNCQTWVREVVGKLVEEGLLEAGALQVVEGAPKN